MIGPRIGSRIGLAIGLAVGVGADELKPAGSGGTGIAGVTRDATSLIYTPASAAEWTTFNTATGRTAVPSNLYLCQEAAGNLTDTIGGVSLVANASPLYQQAISGWTRKGVGFNETASQRFLAGAGVGPNPATQSVAWLVYANVTAIPGTTRDIVCAATGASPLKLQTLNSTGAKLRSLCIAAGVNGVSDPTSTGLQPMLMVYDRTLGQLNHYTLQEKFSGTYSAAVVDASKGFGAGTGNSHPTMSPRPWR